MTPQTQSKKIDDSYTRFCIYTSFSFSFIKDRKLPIWKLFPFSIHISSSPASFFPLLMAGCKLTETQKALPSGKRGRKSSSKQPVKCFPSSPPHAMWDHPVCKSCHAGTRLSISQYDQGSIPKGRRFQEMNDCLTPEEIGKMSQVPACPPVWHYIYIMVNPLSEGVWTVMTVTSL